MAEFEVKWFEPRRIRTKTYLLGIYLLVSLNSNQIRWNSYMSQQNGSHQETGERNSISHLFHDRASRPKGWRRDIRSTIVVDNNANNNISKRNHRLTDNQCFCILSRVTHLRCNREKGWSTRVGKNEGRDCRCGIRKTGIIEKFVV